jgi:protease-4
MKQFFKYVGASALGSLIVGVVLAFFFVYILVGAFENSVNQIFGDLENESEEIEENSVLHLRLSSEMPDQGPVDEWDFGLGGLQNIKKAGLNSILECIERAKTDDHIKGIYLDVSDASAGLAQIEEIRNKLIEFKKSGKFIYAFGEFYNHKGYYLASVSNVIAVYPEGLIQFTGLNSTITFYKGLIDKLGIEVSVIRGSNNKFKSAVEPFLYDKMSASNRKQVSTYLNSLWGHMLKGISKYRKISVDDLNLLADSMQVRNAKDAVKYKLADRVAYKDQIISDMIDLSNMGKEDYINFISVSSYMRDSRLTEKSPKQKRENHKDDDKIAVIYAEGNIIDGKAGDGSIGSQTLSKQIKKARRDETVKGVVLRINSPGGSALASDVIWRELILTRAQKPLIVSMGNVAASGGYYIACCADKIYASPNTITGSIGVFGILPNTENMMKDKLGVTFDRVNTNANSDLGSITRGLSDKEFKIIQQGVDEIYDDFITKVSKGRKKLSKADVDSIGQGRVWTGKDALKLGLVDELGGLEEAIEEAAKRADLSDYFILEIPEKTTPLEQLVSKMKEGTDKTIELSWVNLLGLDEKTMAELEKIKWIFTQKGIHARMITNWDVE